MNLRRKTLLLTAAFVIATLGVVSPAFAATISYYTFLSGPAENPPNASPGTGYALFVYDDVLHTLSLDVTFQGLIGTTTVAHVHAPVLVPGGNAGVATTTPTFLGFPAGVTSGVYVKTLNLTLATSYNPAFVNANGGTTAGAEAALMGAVANGQAYLNIHSSSFSGGEIRGFLQPVPEPASLALLGLGLGAAAIYRRRRR